MDSESTAASTIVPDHDPPGCTTDEECGTNKACFPLAGNHCFCKPGYTACGEQCFDTTDDREHCGSCAPCPPEFVCDRGACVVAGTQHRSPDPGTCQFGCTIMPPPCDPHLNVEQTFSLTDSSISETNPKIIPVGPTVIVDPPTRVSGIDPSIATTCGPGFPEAKPERSLNTGFVLPRLKADPFPPFPRPPPPPSLFTAYGTGSAAGIPNRLFDNSAMTWNGWRDGAASLTDLPSVPTCFGCAVRGADTWSTTSGFTGLDYVATILFSSTGLECPGIAATTPTLRSVNIWDFPLACATTSGVFDGPSIAFDPGGTTLWVVAGFGPSPQPPPSPPPTSRGELSIFEDCAGAPGTDLCPLGASVPITGFFGHLNVAVEPCNHLGMMAVRGNDGHVHLQFYRSSPDETGNFLAQDLVTNAKAQSPAAGDQVTACLGASVANFKLYGPPACDQCTAAGGCANTEFRPQIATQVSNGRCFAYLSYDASFVGGDGQTHLRSRLDVVDTTFAGHSPPTIRPDPIGIGPIQFGAFQLSGFKFGDDSVSWNAFHSDVAAADTATSSGARPVGWFFYVQGPDAATCGNDPCSTVRYAVVSTDQFRSATTTIVTASPFPTTDRSNLGDYQGTISRGLPQGILYPVWAESVRTAVTVVASCPNPEGCTGQGASCVSCFGAIDTPVVNATQLHIP